MYVSTNSYVDCVLVSLSTIWAKLSVIETQQHQQTRILQTVLAALQSTGTTDGSLELPDGIVLPAKNLQELLNIEKLLENGENVCKMVCMQSVMQYDKNGSVSCLSFFHICVLCESF